jgi:hypothetical protein
VQLRDSVDPVSPWRSVCRHVSVASRVVAAQTLPYALSISASDVRTVYSHRAPEGAVCDHSPLTPFHLPMASTLSRSLPVPSGPVKLLATDGPYHNDIYSPANPYHTPPIQHFLLTANPRLLHYAEVPYYTGVSTIYWR